MQIEEAKGEESEPSMEDFSEGLTKINPKTMLTAIHTASDDFRFKKGRVDQVKLQECVIINRGLK